VPAPTVQALADLVGGRVLGEGADRVIRGINDLRSAGPDELSFLANAKYEASARASRAGVILVSPKDAPKLASTCIEVESPNAAFAKIAALFTPPPIPVQPGVHPTAVVAPDARLGEGVSVAPHAVISAGARIGAQAIIGANCFVGEQAVIGEETRLYPLAVIRERCVIGARVIIHSGAVIGSDGFGYEFEQGRYVKIPHTGIVQIDDDAEIGANTTIDRARFGRTHIGRGTKIDNLVMIGHNVSVGEHSIIVAMSGISGSTSVGKYFTLAGQSGLAGHLTVGDRVTITAMSGINKDVGSNIVLSGRHALPAREALKQEALARRLPEFFERLKELEEKLKKLG
jgi:UDP-3-O-[3-hydroxymyristoyl] glucosamine N-acyltransferase